MHGKELYTEINRSVLIIVYINIQVCRYKSRRYFIMGDNIGL